MTICHSFQRGKNSWWQILSAIKYPEERLNISMPGYSEFYFNVDHGYLEGLVRGFKAGILTSADYVNLAQCETLEGKSASLFYLGRNTVA